MPELFSDRLKEDRVLLLDGGLGTELGRRGFPLEAKPWSAAALIARPELVEQIHADYVRAGAELITANTFRTHRRNLDQAGIGNQASDLTVRAVLLARQAAEKGNHRVWVAGSLSPLEDCYTPANVPDENALAIEHAEQARNLADAGADLILVETQNTIREAIAATRAAAETGLPVLVSFVCDLEGRLLSGESLADAASAVLAFHPSGVLVNCLPVAAVPTALAAIKQVASDIPRGVYANVGCYDKQQGWVSTPMEQPANYAAEADQWRNVGAKLIGGCCGTTPEHIRQIHQILEQG